MADEIKTPGAEEEYQPDLMTLDEQAKKRYTISTARACGSTESPSCPNFIFRL